MDTTLVVNAGSSSLKVKLLPDGVAASVERIGGDAVLRVRGERVETPPIARHDAALEHALDALATDAAGAAALDAVRVVGHRVVHGGERYTEAVIVDDAVEHAIDALAVLAPLHNPANLAAIRAARSRLPGVPHVAVFDTAFHATLPPEAYLFGLPFELYRDEGIRRYGFHGTSHDYVTRSAAERMGARREDLRLVSLHLGNGASAAAVAHGRCIDTTMGFTPLDGLLMGTRCGDLDPGVVLHLLRDGRSPRDLDAMLNTRSGLLGVSGISNDMRDVRRAAADGSARAARALALFGYRVKKTVGAFAAAMGGLDGVVFTGGIGENDPTTRAECLAGLEAFGIRVDDRANRAGGPELHARDSDVAVLAIPTDEEAMIAVYARARIA